MKVLLANLLREAAEIPSFEKLAEMVDNELKSILLRERKQLSGGGIAQPQSIVEIAKQLSGRIILPYFMIHGLPVPANHRAFLESLAKVEKLRGKVDEKCSGLDYSIRTLLSHMHGGMEEVYEMLYHGCGDIHFQRVCGVSNQRKDFPGDYTPSSEKLRCFISSRNESYLLVCCTKSNEEEDVYD